jgi:thiamine kinase-like enzyme
MIQSIIDQLPAWRHVRQITVEPRKGGLTNANYLVSVDGERFVLRLSGDITAQLGIHRQTERDALMAASSGGIAPGVVLFILPEGHLVTRFIEGHEWTIEEFKYSNETDSPPPHDRSSICSQQSGQPCRSRLGNAVQ